MKLPDEVKNPSGYQGFRILRLEMPPRDYKLFGFLLDSIEGLATHSRVENTGILEIQFPECQTDGLNSFLDHWRGFSSPLR